MGVTELAQMMGTEPNLALSVLDGLGRWEAGRSGGGMDPQRKGWGSLQDRAEEIRGGGVSRKSDVMLKTPPEPNLKKGGV